MTRLCSDVLLRLQDKQLVTAESCTGGWIGAALTGVPGSSSVYKGGIISYCDEVKRNILGVPGEILDQCGAVCAPVAEAMAIGARKVLNADVAVSVTGLAGPGGDNFGNEVGTVYIGYCDAQTSFARKFHFSGSREEIRRLSAENALKIILEHN